MRVCLDQGHVIRPNLGNSLNSLLTPIPKLWVSSYKYLLGISILHKSFFPDFVTCFKLSRFFMPGNSSHMLFNSSVHIELQHIVASHTNISPFLFT